MKLRQKLAMVLAATTIVTAVPVVTFAASSNAIVNKETGKKDREYKVSDGTTGPILRIKLEDELILSRGSIFYLEFDGFELYKNEYQTDDKWTIGTSQYSGLTVENKKTLKVDLSSYGTNLLSGDTIYIPLYGKVTGDIATVTIDNNNLAISADTLTFAESKDAKCAVTVEDVTTIFDEGTIGDIVFSEPYANVVNSITPVNRTVAGVSTNCYKIKLSINNRDYEFTSNQSITVKFGKGFAAVNHTLHSDCIEVNKYGDELTLYIPQSAFTFSASKGAFVITGIEVETNTKTPKAGDLTINIDSDLAEVDDLKVADIVLTDTKLYMKDEKVVEITAGQDKEVTFYLEENVKDGIIPNHTVDFELSEGAYFGIFKETGSLTVDDATRNQKVASFKNILGYSTSDVDIVDVKMDGTKFVGFTAKFTNAPTTSKDKFEFKAPLCVDLDTADATEITLTASGERAIDEEVSCVVAKIVAPIKVEADAMVVKVGLQKQKYDGALTITETANGKIDRGNIVISTPSGEGYKFTGKGEVKVTAGDLVINKWAINGNSIVIEVKNPSKTASTIEITGFEVDFNRTVPEGTYPVFISGTALVSDHSKDGGHSHGSIEVEDFFRVNTPNTEDIKAGALKAVEASFTVGSAEYVVDDATYTMDAAAYIQNGRIMVPVRYLSDAFGISPQNILFNDGVVSIIAGDKIVQLKVGSDIITVNGAAIKMDAKAEVKDGRSYVPMKFIAAALGVEASWDEATKTATFSNKN